jgi:hypothetical protein
MTEVLRFKGGRSRATINPNPRVTADVDKGIMKRGSRNEAILFFGPARYVAASNPRVRAIPIVAIAKIKELITALCGGTKKMDWVRF